jgi:hypothetical protein
MRDLVSCRQPVSNALPGLGCVQREEHCRARFTDKNGFSKVYILFSRLRAVASAYVPKGTLVTDNSTLNTCTAPGSIGTKPYRLTHIG